MTEKGNLLRIWRQNLNRSLIAQNNLLNNTNPSYYDILALQEPHIDFLNRTQANSHWAVLYPSTHNKTQDKVQSVMLVNQSLPTSDWKAVEVTNPDVTAM